MKGAVMTIHYLPTKQNSAKEQLEKQLFRDVQKLGRYLDTHKAISNDPSQDVVESYEKMIQERWEAIDSIARR